jgi:molybdenum cofactor cytidylyltransferase
VPVTDSVAVSLLEALGLGPRGVVSVVGAGGKSTLVRRLVSEARAAGIPTLLSATTRLGATAAEGLRVSVDGPAADDELRAALARDGAVAWAGPPRGAGCWAGLHPERIDGVARRVALTIVEADGARGRLLKLPAEHEPLVPASTTLVLVVAASGALGRPAAAGHVHRLEHVRAALARAGRDPDTPLEAEALADLLLDEAGYLARVPPGARAAVFLNQRGATLAPQALDALAARVLRRWELVVCGSSLGGPVRVARAPLLSSPARP